MSVPLADDVRRSLNARITIRKADYAADEPAIRAVRFEVFVDEQGVPPEIEMDDRDAHCVHFLAHAGDDAVATARIDVAQAGKVGRLAVRSSWRRQGVGRALMEHCHEMARRHGLDSVWCNAQVTAVPFYKALGYEVSSDSFEEAGIEHRRMTKTLKPREH